MARSGSFWTDPRLLILVGFLMMMQWFGGFVWSSPEPTPVAVEETSTSLHPTRLKPGDPGALESVDKVLTDTRIRRINPDGSARWEPPSAAEVSAAVGGVILLLGGLLSMWSWRRADAAGDDPDDGRQPVVRNAADGRWR